MKYLLNHYIKILNSGLYILWRGMDSLLSLITVGTCAGDSLHQPFPTVGTAGSVLVGLTLAGSCVAGADCHHLPLPRLVRILLYLLT